MSENFRNLFCINATIILSENNPEFKKFFIIVPEINLDLNPDSAQHIELFRSDGIPLMGVFNLEVVERGIGANLSITYISLACNAKNDIRHFKEIVAEFEADETWGKSEFDEIFDVCEYISLQKN